MKKWVRRSLKNQLIVFILIVVLIPICLLGLFSYYTTIQVSKERAAISGKSSLKLLGDSLEFIVNDVENMSVFLIGNQSVQEYLKVEGELITQQRDIYGFLSNLAFSKRYIDNILITPLNGNSNISTTLAMENKEKVFEEKLSGKWWSFKRKNETLDGPKEMITLTRPIRSTDDYEPIGYLSISLNQNMIEEYLNSTDLEWSGSVFILNQGKVLAENQTGVSDNLDISGLSSLIKNWKGEGSFTYEMDEKKATIFSREISTVEWDLVGVIPFREYSSQNRYFLWLTIYSVILAALLVTGLVIFFISKVFRPLTSLKESIQKSNPGDSIKTIDSYSNNEIGELIRSYNGLNNKVATLMDKVKKSESIKRELDLQALQSQINPHFLYNTLASVHWIALSSKAHNISKVVSSLSDFLRFSLNKGHEYCTVEQEVGHLMHYVRIQEIRYPDTFKVDLSISTEIKQSFILKLVLQPLIENSILHGFFPLENHYGIIEIKAKKKDDHMCFTVKDNGVGIPQERIKELREQFISDQNAEGVIGKNYGIRNVNLRLILHYGKSSGLHIFSDQNNGTMISFSVPIKGR